MNDFEILFDEEIYGSYSQVAIFDAEDKDSYPQWKTGDEYVVFGFRGAVVATAADQVIHVIVCKGKGTPEYVFCVSGEILIGTQGLIIGNIASENIVPGIRENGRYAIVIYTNGLGSNVTQVYFFVEYLGHP